ncbi:MAG TPA: 2-phospho-L-lactate transferase CofD family protein, partial [Anaerolineae bacterium]
MNLLAFAGGVGGAKLAEGLVRAVGAEQLTVIVNTADDFTLYGLHISPDLDTVMYALAGIANPETGWGIKDDTWQNFDMLARYGAEPWFHVGDCDLATHLLRTQMISNGATLSQATHELAERLKIEATLLPMSDDSVHTLVDSDKGALPFQEYFVKYHWQPVVRG